jgi:hypothetical protein
LYRDCRRSEDFLPILFYYENYKDVWFAQLSDYMDRMTFESEFDFKLVHAINTFDPEHAEKNAVAKGLSRLGNFNRWFYKILTNWKSNVKTSSFRLKKRPPVTCPVCGRRVGRIDENHLQHWKTKSDLPRFMFWKGKIYDVFTKPAVYAVTWGDKTAAKWADFRAGKFKDYNDEKRRIRWPWRLPDGSRGVLCPFTKRIVPEITEEYIRSLPDKHSRYAEPTSWEEFVIRHPNALIQSEPYSLDHTVRDEESFLSGMVAGGRPEDDDLDYQEIQEGRVTQKYEYTFKTIEQCIHDEVDQGILKLIASGYEVDDIAETLEMEKKEVRRRIRAIRDCKELEEMLKS